MEVRTMKSWIDVGKGGYFAADRIIVAVTKGDNLLQAFDANGNEQWSFVAPK